MGITIEITLSNNVTTTCATTIYITSNGALYSGISVFVQLLVHIINNIFVSKFFFLCCIRNPTQAITILSGSLYSANVNLVKTTVHYMRLQSKLVPQITLLGHMQRPFTTRLTVGLLVVLVSLFNCSHKSLTFSFLTFSSFAIIEIQYW